MIQRTVHVSFEYESDSFLYHVDAEVEVQGDEYKCTFHDAEVKDDLWRVIAQKAEEKAIDQDAYVARELAAEAAARAADDAADAAMDRRYLMSVSKEGRFLAEERGVQP